MYPSRNIWPARAYRTRNISDATMVYQGRKIKTDILGAGKAPNPPTNPRPLTQARIGTSSPRPPRR